MDKPKHCRVLNLTAIWQSSHQVLARRFGNATRGAQAQIVKRRVPHFKPNPGHPRGGPLSLKVNNVVKKWDTDINELRNRNTELQSRVSLIMAELAEVLQSESKTEELLNTDFTITYEPELKSVESTTVALLKQEEVAIKSQAENSILDETISSECSLASETQVDVKTTESDSMKNVEDTSYDKSFVDLIERLKSVRRSSLECNSSLLELLKSYEQCSQDGIEKDVSSEETLNEPAELQQGGDGKNILSEEAINEQADIKQCGMEKKELEQEKIGDAPSKEALYKKELKVDKIGDAPSEGAFKVPAKQKQLVR